MLSWKDVVGVPSSKMPPLGGEAASPGTEVAQITYRFQLGETLLRPLIHTTVMHTRVI